MTRYILCLCFLLTTSVALGQNLITNGSFESASSSGAGGEGTGRKAYIAGTHNTDITGWTLSAVGDVYIHESPALGNAIGANFNFAHSGDRYLDLSGGIGGGTSGNHATISQTFTTVPSTAYRLSFVIGAAYSPAETINVKVTGVATLLDQTLTANAPQTNINWKIIEYQFIADSTATTLSFRDVSNSDDNVSFVDTVSVVRIGDETSIGGIVALQGAQNAVQPIDFTFRPTTGDSFTRTVTLGFAGGYTIENIPLGEYTVSIKGAKWLRKNISVDARTGNVTNANATLLAGDANNDNFADIADLLLLINAYNNVSPASGYSEAADFNCDGGNDIADLLLLIINYNRQGDSLP